VGGVGIVPSSEKSEKHSAKAQRPKARTAKAEKRNTKAQRDEDTKKKELRQGV
jgi:hypothetical protein